MRCLWIYVIGNKTEFNEYIKRISSLADNALVFEQSPLLAHKPGDPPELIVVLFNTHEGMALDFVYQAEANTQLKSVPVILATGIKDEIFMKAALNTTALDVISLPINPGILLLRINKLLFGKSRPQAYSPHKGIIPLLNKENLTVIYKQHQCNLTPKEFELLELLVNRVNSVVNRDEINKMLWPGKKLSDTRIIDTYIRKLRAKLGKRLITTLIGKGYIIRG